MKNRRSSNAFAGLTILGASVFLFFSTRELPPRPHPELPRATGRILAEEATRWFKPGGVVVAITRDTESFTHPESDLQFQAFQETLEASGTPLTSVQRLQVDPLRPLEVPPGDFFELIRRAPPGSVLVSFMGPPRLSPEQRDQLTAIQPKILAFCPGAIPSLVDLRPLFDDGLLHAAVVDRSPPGTVEPTAAADAAPSGFDARYRLVRLGDAASLEGFQLNSR